MTNTIRVRCLTLCFTAATVLAGSLPASAQYLLLSPTLVETPDESSRSASSPRPSLLKPFTEVFTDIRHLPRRDNINWLAIGIVAAAGAHSADSEVSRELSRSGTNSFRPGAIVGGTPLELGAAFATYAIARATNSPRAMSLGSDLIRAQILAELMATGLKQGVRRARPQGSGFSFPSGHTTVTFASATVLQQHFGWKAGIPAYAVASYVAASRVQMKRHYLSDVAFGAALGIVAGRTVTVGHRLMLSPTVTPGGGAATFTWIGKQ